MKFYFFEVASLVDLFPPMGELQWNVRIKAAEAHRVFYIVDYDICE